MSLTPLKFDEAMSDLLEVKLEAKKTNQSNTNTEASSENRNKK
jgi:hypothetical protein